MKVLMIIIIAIFYIIILLGVGYKIYRNNENLAGIGKKYNKRVAQVILRWLVQGYVVVLTKSTNLDRIKENLNLNYKNKIWER